MFLRGIQTQILFVVLGVYFGISEIRLYAQEKSIPSVPDSLKIYQNHRSKAALLINSSFDSIRTVFSKFRDNPKIYPYYAAIYIQKAKNEGDTIEIANGYDLMFKRTYLSNQDLAFRYIDSLIDITKHVKHTYYPSRGYLNKGILLTHTKRYEEALSYYLKGEKYAKENNNISHQLAIKHSIGRLKNILNKHEEALETYLENLKFLETNSIKNEHEIIYLSTLYGLADSYNKLGDLQVADGYIRTGISACLQTDERYFYPNFLLEYGINNTLQQKYDTALDSLYKSETLFPDSDAEVVKHVSRMYIGKNLYALGKKEEAFAYLKKVDAAINESNYIPDLRESFELLISYFKEKKDINNHVQTLEKLIVLDSISYQTQKKLNIDITKKYDNKLLVKDRDLLIEKLSAQSKKDIKKVWTYATLFILLSGGLFFWYYYKKKIQQKDLQLIIQEKQQIIQNSIRVKKTKKELEIPQKLFEELTQKLTTFEQKKKFLNNAISLMSLSKELDTNSSYLSKVINKTSNKNFANYINDLRIEYAIEKLNTDSKYRLYSISAIAHEVGFNNLKSFSRAFLKKTGKHPSVFIKELL